VKVLMAIPLPGTLVPLTDIKVYGAAIAALAKDDQIAARTEHKRLTLKPFAAVVSGERGAMRESAEVKSANATGRRELVIMSDNPLQKLWR